MDWLDPVCGRAVIQRVRDRLVIRHSGAFVVDTAPRLGFEPSSRGVEEVVLESVHDCRVAYLVVAELAGRAGEPCGPLIEPLLCRDRRKPGEPLVGAKNLNV